MSTNSQVDAASRAGKIRVLMVCLGNICRSPTAHGVLEKLIENKGLSRQLEVDSAGTSTYHLGSAPDPRSIEAAARRGYSLEKQVARQVRSDDFHDFDYVLAMDVDNLSHLRSIAPAQSRARVQLLLDYSNTETTSVPDPYFGDAGAGFETVLDLVEDACERFLQQLEDELINAKGES